MSDIERTTTQLPEPAGQTWGVRTGPGEQGIVRLRDRYGLFVDGRSSSRRPAGTSRRSTRRTEEPLAEVAEAGAEDVDLAARAAGRPARRAGAILPGKERAKYLYRIARATGALARVRRAREHERRQADQGVTGRRRTARGRALLLLRGMGRQARVRVPGPVAAAARRRGADDPVELPAADVRRGSSRRARDREHGDPEAGLDHAAHGAAPGRGGGAGRAAARRRERHHRSRRKDRRLVGGAPGHLKIAFTGSTEIGKRSAATSPGLGSASRSSSAARPRTSSSRTPRSIRRSRGS